MLRSIHVGGRTGQDQTKGAQDQLALTVYRPQEIEAEGYRIGSSQTFANAGPNAFAWLALGGDHAEADLAQFWRASGDRLGLTVLTPDQKNQYRIAYTKFFPLRTTIAWFAAEGRAGLCKGWAGPSADPRPRLALVTAAETASSTAP
jgi:hypothetical protein